MRGTHCSESWRWNGKEKEITLSLYKSGESVRESRRPARTTPHHTTPHWSLSVRTGCGTLVTSPMAISSGERHAPAGGDSGGGKLWNLCRMPFRQAGGAPASAPPHSSSSSSGIHHSAGRYGHEAPVTGDGVVQAASAGSISSVAKSLLPARRRLRLDPANKLYFPCKHARN